MGALAFQCIRADQLCSKYDNFACLHTRQDQNRFRLKRWFLSPKSATSVSRSQAHLAKRYSSVYTTIFVRRKNKTYYLSLLYELSVTIHDISTCWKKTTLNGGPYTNVFSCVNWYLKGSVYPRYHCDQETILYIIDTGVAADVKKNNNSNTYGVFFSAKKISPCYKMH